METLDMDAPIVGVRRITRAQAILWTQNRPIGRVAGMIYDEAVSRRIDPAFALAEAILETGWGTSVFARNRHNWFAYQAYYEDPNQARTFAQDLDGIRIPLEDMSANYFSPGGRYWAGGNGATLSGWAKEWVDGPPAHWQGACRQILALMRAAMRTLPEKGTP